MLNFTFLVCGVFKAIYPKFGSIALCPMGSRVALKRVALLIGTPKLRSAEGVPIIFLLLSGSRSGTQYFADLFGRVPLLDLSKKIAKIYQKNFLID